MMTSFLLKAIEKGKHVVTANKALLSTRGEEIFKAVFEHQVDIGYYRKERRRKERAHEAPHRSHEAGQRGDMDKWRGDHGPAGRGTERGAQEVRHALSGGGPLRFHECEGQCRFSPPGAFEVVSKGD